MVKKEVFSLTRNVSHPAITSTQQETNMFTNTEQAKRTVTRIVGMIGIHANTAKGRLWFAIVRLRDGQTALSLSQDDGDETYTRPEDVMFIGGVPIEANDVGLTIIPIDIRGQRVTRAGDKVVFISRSSTATTTADLQGAFKIFVLE